MQKVTSLMVLVASLTKAEKRYFRLYSSLQAGDKKYVDLFDLIEQHGAVDTVRSLFCAKYNSNSFNMAVKHLYQTIMDCLVYFHKRKDIPTKIFHILSEADILYERSLFGDAIELVNKAKKLASVYEIDTLTLLACRTELKYLNALDFRNVSERQLINKQMKIVEGMKYSRSANLHSQLYDILKHRLIYKGYARSEKQKENLNDLILSELNIVANNSYKGFETQKLHLLFQSTYYLHSGNYKMAIRFYQTLIDLFEPNRHMILNPPIYYLQAIVGILNSLMAASLYREMPFFINKLKAIEEGDYAKEFKLNVLASIFLYEFGAAFHVGDFTLAADLVNRYEESLFKNISLLRLERQLDLYISLTVLDLATGNLKNARKNMKKIMGAGKLFYVLPAYRHARLINLLLQAELQNYDFFENEIKAIKRSLRDEKQGYITEKLLFKFVLHAHLLDRQKIRDKLLKQLRRETVKIFRNQYEQQLLVTFDFLSWMESQLTPRPFREILAGRSR
jgi:hypothetical protein